MINLQTPEINSVEQSINSKSGRISFIKKVPSPPGFISSNFLCLMFSGTTALPLSKNPISNSPSFNENNIQIYESSQKEISAMLGAIYLFVK